MSCTADGNWYGKRKPDLREKSPGPKNKQSKYINIHYNEMLIPVKN